MTAAGMPAPARRGLRVPSWRLLRLEVRRNPLPWTAPLLALLCWYDSYRTSVSFPPPWVEQVLILQAHVVIDLAPFVVAVAAWTGARDGRRGTAELVTATSRPRPATRLAAWAAVAAWSVAAYAAWTAVMFAVIARHATWGGPPWWVVASGAASMVAFSAVGFTIGALVPSRYTAPAAAIIVLLVLFVLFKQAIRGDRYALIAPANEALGHKPPADIGIFYPYLPDVSLDRLIFLAGITVAALAALGLPAASGGRRLRVTCAAVTALGVTVAAGAVALTGTARVRAHGMMAIPALHDAADDRPTGYRPVCGGSAVPICVHPAFRGYLPDLTAALAPVLGEVAGLPGAPARVSQIATDYLAPEAGQTVAGDPPVLALPLAAYRSAPGYFPDDFVIADLRTGAGITIVNHVVAGGGGDLPRREPGAELAPAVVPELRGDPAQQAVETALLIAAGVPLGARCARKGIVTACGAAPLPARGTPVRAAAERFAGLPDAARRDWLVRHLTDLRAGRISPARLP